jgi:hypothetical protein
MSRSKPVPNARAASAALRREVQSRAAAPSAPRMAGNTLERPAANRLMAGSRGLVRGLVNAYQSVDRATGGILPGGGTGNFASGAVSEGLRRGGRTVKTLRDVAIAPLPLPERLAITAMTGGTRDGGPMRTLPERNLREIKGIADERREDRQRLKDDPSSFGWALPMAQQVLSGGQVSGYHRGSRDLHLGLGSFGLYDEGKGAVVVMDRWKVDRARGDTPTFKADLQEGGSIPQLLFEAARRTGLYRPVDIDVQVPREKWESMQGIRPREDTRPGTEAIPLEEFDAYTKGPQYQAGKDGVFFQGRNVAPWGLQKAWGPRREQKPAIPQGPMGSVLTSGASGPTANEMAALESHMSNIDTDKMIEELKKKLGTGMPPPNGGGHSGPVNYNFGSNSFEDLGEY